MGSFMQQFYESSPHVPAEIIVEVEPDDRAVVQNWLKEKRKNTAGADGNTNVTITAPKRGDKVRLVEMVKQNAQQVLEQQRIKWLTDSQKTQLALEELQEALNLATPPRRIECYDISNTQGTNSVGAMVVFEGGRPKNSEYRRFKIKQVEGANDVASHQEVLRRRFRTRKEANSSIASAPDEDIAAPIGETIAEIIQDGRQKQQGQKASDTLETDEELTLQHDWAIPDLIIIDGGRGQLNGALDVLHELHVEIPIMGLAKDDGSHTKLATGEQIFVPGSPEPILLPRTSQGLYLLQRIRDEAHRFGITYHRQVRSTRTFKSALDEIPGIGPKRKQALLKHFGSVRAISAASIDELAALDGMTRDAAEKVKEYIGRVE
jgi:excinuclease ABC subunit C